jgi:DNA-binding response OmpR family regulator
MGAMMNANQTILIAEDDGTVARWLGHSFEQDGFSVVVACDGPLALDMMRRWAPDLIMIERVLPVIDGVDVCCIVRRESATPIIIIAALTAADDAAATLDLGADDYVTRPFGTAKLLARVHALLRRARVRSQQA